MTNKPLLTAEVSIDNNYHYHICLIVRSRFFAVNVFIQNKEAAPWYLSLPVVWVKRMISLSVVI